MSISQQLLYNVEEIRQQCNIETFSYAVFYGVMNNLFTFEEGFFLLLARPEIQLSRLTIASEN